MWWDKVKGPSCLEYRGRKVSGDGWDIRRGRNGGAGMERAKYWVVCVLMGWGDWEV